MTIAPGQGAGGRAFARRCTVIVDDYQAEIGAQTPLGRRGARAAIATPIPYEGRPHGALVVHTFRPDKRFTPADGEVLELLASIAAAALLGLEQARLEGPLLAARTAQHELSNQLALTVGHAELLTINPALPPELLDAASEALRGAEAAAATLQRLQRITRLEETDWGPQTKPTIDLGRSTE